MKYRGVDRIARALASVMVGDLPASCRALVPIPRSLGRTIRYGIDPGDCLAGELCRLAGVPMIRALRVPPIRPSQVRNRTSVKRFRLAKPVPEGAVLVDDVLTTGATLNAAALAFGDRVRHAVTASRSTYG